MVVICICLLAELRLSEYQDFSWLKGFNGFASCSTDPADEDIERQSEFQGVETWSKPAVPIHFPYVVSCQK